MTLKRTAAVLGAGALAFAASWGPALASHNGAVVTTTPTGECGETTFEATIDDPAGTHKSDNLVLVVSAEGNTETAVNPVDGSAASITVGPFTNFNTLDVEGCPGGGIEVCLGGGVDLFDLDAVLSCLEAELMLDFGGLS